MLRSATERLTAAGIDSAAHDARRLLAEALRIPAAELVLVPAVTAEARTRFEALIQRRARREPLQHIVGRAAFRHVVLEVGPGVFVPRPETECVAGAAIDAMPASGPAVAVDLCSGSGAIAVSIAVERPRTTVYAVEVSPAAVAWLRRNVAAHVEVMAAHGSTVLVVPADIAELHGRHDFPLGVGSVDVVVSNPPYIPDGAIPRDPEVAQHDPGVALYGGPDGLDIVRVVESVGRRLLRSGGTLLIEHGDTQGDEAGSLGVPHVLHTADQGGSPAWSQVADCRDLTGRPRFTMAHRSLGGDMR